MKGRGAVSDKPYWHKVMTDDVFDKMVADRPEMTWKDVLFEYEQPDWCNYKDALFGRWGCWLLALKPLGVECIDDCEDCECVKTKFLPLDRRIVRCCNSVAARVRRAIRAVKRRFNER